MARALIPRLPALVLAACAGAGLAAAGSAVAGTDTWQGLERFARVYGQVRAWHKDDPDGDTLVDGALHGMFAALDPYSAYFTAAEWKKVEAETDGTTVGIGADIAGDPCGLRLLSVTPSGPAERANLRAGDCILTIDDVPARRVEQLDGDADVALRLVVDQDGARRTAVVLRTRVAPVLVQVAPAPNGTAWVHVASFRNGAAADLDRQLTGLGPVQGLVLDLRQNGGGALEEAVAVADRFLGAGDLVRTEGRGPGVAKTYTSTDSATDFAGPVVVLVDHGSASAAEIVAGALRARGRAKLVGTSTFGKGSVQTWFHQDDGGTARITVGAYVLPDGTHIDAGHGLTPDVTVELPTVPSPLGRLQDRVKSVPGLSPSDRAALLAEVQNLGQTNDTPGTPSFGAPLEQRVTLDPQLAAAFAQLKP